MGIFKKDKNEGLSEENRLDKHQFEKARLESMERLKTNLPNFQKEYNNLVEEYGLVHVIRYNLTPERGVFATIEIQDCWPQVQEMKKKAEEMKQKDKGNGVIKD